MPPSDCSSLSLSHSAEAALSTLSSLPGSSRGTRLLLPHLQEETAQAKGAQRLCMSHGTRDRVRIQGEEVWLQSLGSDLQTSEGFQTDPHLFGEILIDMFLFSDFKFKCLLRVTRASLVAQMVKSLDYMWETWV